MKELFVLVQKELVEMIRSYKWVWMPLLFISLGIMQPLTSYYLSDILEEFGGLSEGTIIKIPQPLADQVFSETLGQFSQIGTFIVVLAIMGMLTNERTSGIAAMILVKPISYTNYFSSKWIAAVILVMFSFLVGVVSSIYYIQLLFEPLAWQNILVSSGLYAIWLLFVITLVLMLSAIQKRTGAVAATSILLLISFSVLASLFKEPLKWTPGNLLTLAQAGIADKSLIGISGTISLTVGLIVVMGITAVLYMKQGEWLR